MLKTKKLFCNKENRGSAWKASLTAGKVFFRLLVLWRYEFLRT